METIKGLYLKHHKGNCFDNMFKLSILGDSVLKVHSAIDVNDIFQFAFHEFGTANTTSEIQWNRKTNKLLRFFRLQDFFKFYKVKVNF